MKSILLFCFFLSTVASGAPVLNLNQAAEGTLITIWPDHLDPNHFYFAPNLISLSEDKTGKAKFNVITYKGSCNIRRRCKRRAMVIAFFKAGYLSEQLALAQTGIRKRYPQARFSAIPFMSSRVVFGKSLRPMIYSHECSPQGGQAADEVPCTITLNGRGIKSLLPNLNEGKPVPFNFFYKIRGVAQEADGGYRNEDLEYSISVNLGGPILMGHDDLQK